MSTISHTGTVVEIHGGEATVELSRTEQCGSPGARCATCASASAKPHRVRVDGTGLQEGDAVCLSIPASAGYMSAFVLFGLPVILMVAGGAIGSAVAGDGSQAELPLIIGGLAGFLLGLATAVLVNAKVAGSGFIRVRRAGQREH